MSSLNLMALVNQLQSFEHSLSSILIELALKIGNLTETNVFLLVEGQDGGRKIAGRRHLCQQYLDGLLAPLNAGADVELELSTGANPLRPVTPRHFDFSNGLSMNIQSQNAQMSQMVNRPKDDGPVRKKAKRTTDLGPLHSIQGANEVRETNEPVKIEASCDPDNTPVVIIEDDENTSFKEIKSINMSETMSISKSMNTPDNLDLPGALQISELTSLSQQFPHDTPDFADDNILNEVCLRLSADKVSALHIVSGENACQRGTIENRLAASLCYDFGKTLADLRTPGLEKHQLKTFFGQNWDKWIAQFVNLTPFFKTSCSNGRAERGQTCTFLGLLRHNARLSFNQRVERSKT